MIRYEEKVKCPLCNGELKYCQYKIIVNINREVVEDWRFNCQNCNSVFPYSLLFSLYKMIGGNIYNE